MRLVTGETGVRPPILRFKIGLGGPQVSGWPAATYYLRSTVLGGGVISQYQGDTGQAEWSGTYVYAGAQRIGMLSRYGAGYPRNFWRAADPLTGDEVSTTDGGVMSTQATYDPQGVEVGLSDPFPPPGAGDGECIEYDPNYVPPVPFAASLIPDGTSAKCIVDGIEQSCQLASSEATTKCPDNDCGPRVRVDPDTGKTYLAFINAFADGYVGFMPIGSIYLGHGQYESPGWYPDPESTPLEFNHASSLPQRLKPIPEPKTPEQLLGDCRISAMLVALATAEGTDADADGGYGRVVRGTVLTSPNNPALVGQTNVTITDFSQHPNILVQVNANLTSTAAGRYQFKYATWTGLNLSEFIPHNQDIGAVIEIRIGVRPAICDSLTTSPRVIPNANIHSTLSQVLVFPDSTCCCKILAVRLR